MKAWAWGALVLTASRLALGCQENWERAWNPRDIHAQVLEHSQGVYFSDSHSLSDVKGGTGMKLLVKAVPLTRAGCAGERDQQFLLRSISSDSVEVWTDLRAARSVKLNRQELEKAGQVVAWADFAGRGSAFQADFFGSPEGAAFYQAPRRGAKALTDLQAFYSETLEIRDGWCRLAVYQLKPGSQDLWSKKSFRRVEAWAPLFDEKGRLKAFFVESAELEIGNGQRPPWLPTGHRRPSKDQEQR